MTKATQLTITNEQTKKGLKEIGGNDHLLANHVLYNQVVNALWYGNRNDKKSMEDQQFAAALMMEGFNPKDTAEGLLIAQMIATHNGIMECYKRSMLPEQSFEGRAQTLAFANKLSRTYAMQMDTLQRYRGKGNQKMTVEHVHVHAGGQAVVGMVDTKAGTMTGGGTTTKSGDLPHAKALTHEPVEPISPLWSEDSQGHAVPIGSHAEREMQDARRHKQRRT